MNDAKSKRPGHGPGHPAERDAAPPSAPPPREADRTVGAPHIVAAAAEAVLPAAVATDLRQAAESAASIVAPEDAWAVFARVQAALAGGFADIVAEVAGLARSHAATAADGAVALLGARTLAEAVEINAGVARRGADAMIEGAARLSEIGVKAIADATRPILGGPGARLAA